MRTGEYKVKFNYTILRGFIDAFGLVMAVLLYQTTYAYYYQMAHPTMVLNNVYPDGIPLYMWICGGIVPFVALVALVFSVVYMFIPHKSRTLVITADNAQKYYDNLMITNSLLRILVLMSLWDLTYISQSNLMGAMGSWFSLQTLLDVIVGALVVYFMYGRLKAIAKPAGKKKKSEIKQKSGDKDDETPLAKVKIVKDDDTIMRS